MTTRMTSALEGAIYKLASTHGTLLGTVTVPRHWAEDLDRRKPVEFLYTEGMAVRMTMGLPLSQEGPLVHCGLLSFSYDIPGALVLRGVSLEQFETIRGCAFTPGAGYLRSLVA